MENALTYCKKAKYFEEALPLGNGRLGAMVFGNLRRERIALNEDSLWSGYPKDLNKKDAYQYLPALREAVFNGDYQRAAEIANRDLHGYWTESYLPFGDLTIQYSGIPKQAYQRTLDISKGIARVKTEGFCQTVFVSYPADLIVIRLKGERLFSCKISMSSLLNHRLFSGDEILFMEGRAPEICMPPYYRKGKSVVYGKRGMRFCAAVKVLGEAVYRSEEIVISKQKEAVILISLATSFVDFKSMPTANAKQRALARLTRQKKGYKQLKEEHIRDFSALFDRVDFHLEGGFGEEPTDERLKKMEKGREDPSLISLLFQYGRYLTISASRKGTTAANLQGIWNERLRAPWSSNYTLNINTQMNYWGTDVCALSECVEPLFDLAQKLCENGKVTAKDYYGCGGAVAHHNSDIWGNTNPAGDPMGKEDCQSYSLWVMSLPWILNSLYDHACYLNDPKFTEKLIPMFRDCLEFFCDFLVEKDGELVTCPSLSPENRFEKEGKWSLSYLCSMDREILFDFFYICRRLGLETPEIAQVKPAADGRIPEWYEKFEETEPEHRHLSHLYCIYPSSFEASEELKQAAEKSLLARGFGGTGWSLAWKVCLWARLGEADKALCLIRNQLSPVSPGRRLTYSGGGTYPNLLDAHPPFQIDGNFGVTAGIAELLKRETLPSCWSGYIRGLKNYGGKTVSYSFKNGKRVD